MAPPGQEIALGEHRLTIAYDVADFSRLGRHWQLLCHGNELMQNNKNNKIEVLYRKKNYVSKSALVIWLKK